jgi:hypothetical protein
LTLHFLLEALHDGTVGPIRAWISIFYSIEKFVESFPFYRGLFGLAESDGIGERLRLSCDFLPRLVRVLDNCVTTGTLWRPRLDLGGLKSREGQEENQDE